MTTLNLELIARAALQEGYGGKVYFVSVYRDPVADTYSTYGHNGGYGKTLVEQPKVKGVPLDQAIATAKKLYQQKGKSTTSSYKSMSTASYRHLSDLGLSDPPITATHVDSRKINGIGHMHDQRAAQLKPNSFTAPTLLPATGIACAGRIFAAVMEHENHALAITRYSLLSSYNPLPPKRARLHLTRTSLGVLQKLTLEDGTEWRAPIRQIDAIMIPFPEWSHMVFDCLYTLDNSGSVSPFIADVLAFPDVDIDSLDFLERNSFLQGALAPVSQMLLPWAFTKGQKRALCDKPGNIRAYYFMALDGKLTSTPLMEAETVDELMPA